MIEDRGGEGRALGLNIFHLEGRLHLLNTGGSELTDQDSKLNTQMNLFQSHSLSRGFQTPRIRSEIVLDVSVDRPSIVLISGLEHSRQTRDDATGGIRNGCRQRL